eukprot:3096777-Amphidinium_carterae.1
MECFDFNGHSRAPCSPAVLGIQCTLCALFSHHVTSAHGTILMAHMACEMDTVVRRTLHNPHECINKESKTFKSLTAAQTLRIIFGSEAILGGKECFSREVQQAAGHDLWGHFGWMRLSRVGLGVFFQGLSFTHP